VATRIVGSMIVMSFGEVDKGGCSSAISQCCSSQAMSAEMVVGSDQ